LRQDSIDRTERRLRARIAQLPDGDYYYEDYLEFYNDGRLDPVLARLKLTVAGDQITADFTGSNVQVPGVVNNSLAVAGAGVFVAIKATLDPGGAINEGAFRPITLKAPSGTIFSVALDAAGAHGDEKRAVSVALGALAQIIPDKVSGDLCGSSFPNAIGGWNPRRNRPFVYYEAPAGRQWRLEMPTARAHSSTSTLAICHQSIMPSRVENEMPLMVESCALRTDGGGAGQFRGGVGMVRRLRLLEAEAHYSVLSDRGVIPPWGILGAGAGFPIMSRSSAMVETFDSTRPAR
jgi:N-methylhydantoinase B